MSNLTEAQKRALAWLPADGGWRTNPGNLASGLASLKAAHDDLIEWEWIGFSRHGGMRYRLTAAGIALKAEIEAIHV